jgi:hypothetical protein
VSLPEMALRPPSRTAAVLARSFVLPRCLTSAETSFDTPPLDPGARHRPEPRIGHRSCSTQPGTGLACSASSEGAGRCGRDRRFLSERKTEAAQSRLDVNTSDTTVPLST